MLTEINEVYLMHGTKPDLILKILNGGMNERFCSLGGMYGGGLYFAEDVAKNDNYVSEDNKYGSHKELHKTLFDDCKVKHPG